MKSRIVPVVFAVLATFLGCEFRENTIVPEELIGVWKTAETRYADRFFELNRDVVIFGIGGHTSTVHAILSIETEEVREEAKTLYILYYLSSEGQKYQFSFYYHPAQGVIRFRNQQQFEWTKWTKQSGLRSTAWRLFATLKRMPFPLDQRSNAEELGYYIEKAVENPRVEVLASPVGHNGEHLLFRVSRTVDAGV